MFNRHIESYHDKQSLPSSEIAKFIDNFSAKYLYKCFNPDIPMKVRERSKPVLPLHTCAIGGRNCNFNRREEII